MCLPARCRQHIKTFQRASGILPEVGDNPTNVGWLVSRPLHSEQTACFSALTDQQLVAALVRARKTRFKPESRSCMSIPGGQRTWRTTNSLPFRAHALKNCAGCFWRNSDHGPVIGWQTLQNSEKQVYKCCDAKSLFWNAEARLRSPKVFGISHQSRARCVLNQTNPTAVGVRAV